MGNPHEVMNAPQSSSSNTKATFSGMTALIGVIALIVSIVSVAVPYWGFYSPAGAQYFSAGFSSQENTGNFGPFQSCKNVAYYSFCGGNDIYRSSAWLTVAGICAIGTVICLGLFSMFSVLHVAMQLQRKEIMMSFARAVFFKVVTSAVSVVTCVAAVILGALEFTVGRRAAPIDIRMGICYYLQIVLIFVSALLVFLSYYSYRKYRKNPHLLHIVTKRPSDGAPPPYDNGTNGIAVTQTSGSPYNHGRPRLPIQHQQPLAQSPTIPSQCPPYSFSTGGSPQQSLELQQLQAQMLGSQISANGFMPATLTVPTSSVSVQSQLQSLPVQPIRPIQPVQGVPQIQVTQSAAASLGRTAGVSFTPGGRGTGYNKMSSGPQGAGSMESLDSTQSLTLSTLSYGSSTSTGSGHGPLRSSLKKPKQRDIASVSSRSSSKQVRISLGSEQTTV